METKVLWILLAEKMTDEIELALEDVLEIHHEGLEWKLVCMGGSAVDERISQVCPSRVLRLPKRPRMFWDLGLKSLIAEQISQGFNLIHLYDSDDLGLVLPWMISFDHVPVVVTHGLVVEKEVRHWFQSLFYGRVDSLLVPSASIRRRTVQMRPAFSGKVRVLHPGLDFNLFNPQHFDFKVLRKEWGVNPDSYLVGMIASKEYPKAQNAFVKAAASFLRNEELAERTQFVVVGAEETEDLHRLIEQFHLESHIRLVPFEHSIPKILGSLDVYVLPSSKAMFGLQAIEAMAMGTPIICAQGQDSREWIGNSKAGLLMRSGDSFDLQRKLRMILEGPEELKRMGKRAVQFVRANYDRKQRTQKLLETYERVRRRRARKVVG